MLGEEKFREYVVVWLTSSQFCCPGMIDSHCHAPQYRQLGSANNLPLVHTLSVVFLPSVFRCENWEFSEGQLIVVGLVE